MYLLFRYKNIKPSEYYNMARGDKRICRAFMEVEIKEREKEKQNIMSMFG